VAELSAAVYQNELLPDGGTDLNAIVTLTCGGAGAAGQTGSDDTGEIVIQQGLAAKAAGDVESATTKLGRAVQLAVATGNEEATSKRARWSTSRTREPARSGSRGRWNGRTRWPWTPPRPRPPA